VSNEEYKDLESYGIPISNAGRKRMKFNGSQLINEGNAIRNCVLLNFQGNLLLRHNHKLHGSAANPHFLQKLLATYEGDGVPLVYPEVNLFHPSFGLKSLICAIPCTLLQDDMTLRNVILELLLFMITARLTR
jgi:hypothetical protein